MWMIDFQETGQSHILRDIAMFDSVVRFQLLTAEEATLRERLSLEKALCSIKCFSQVQLYPCYPGYLAYIFVRKASCQRVDKHSSGSHYACCALSDL